MGIQHLRKIQKIFEESPGIEFSQSWFTNNASIDYNQVLLALQYLWENGKIELTSEGKYILKNIYHSK